jgi:hypothetical protein
MKERALIAGMAWWLMTFAAMFSPVPNWVISVMLLVCGLLLWLSLVLWLNSTQEKINDE